METDKLKLPKISGNMSPDVVRDMNALADAIDEKAGEANGLAMLDERGKVPSEQLNIDTSDLATKTELNEKVDKVAGKQLSTEDYTTEDKNKLSGVAAGANKYTHPATHPASMITITDADDLFTSGNVEGALAETANKVTTHWAEDATNAHMGKNIGIEDADGYYTGANVEQALQEIGFIMNGMRGSLIDTYNSIVEM